MKDFKFTVIPILYLVFGSILNAQDKRKISTEDYKDWSLLIPNEISSNGEWVSYGLRYETAMDTLFVKQTETNQEFSFPNSSKGNFSRDGQYFACVSIEKRLSLLDLDKGKIEETANIVEYGFSNSGKFLYTLDQDGVLQLNDLRNKKAISRQGVTHCVFDPLENNLAFLSKNTVGVIDLKGFSDTQIAYSSSYDYQRLTWHVGGKSLAFLGKSKEGKLEVFFYDVRSKQLSNLIPEKAEQFPNNMEVVSSNSFEISQNGDKVYLDIRLKRESDKKEDDTVQIWYSNDKELFPWKEKRLAQYLFKRSVWIPKKEEFKQLEKMSWSRFVFGPNQKYGLAWDIDKYKPSFAYEANADIYIVDLQSGKEKLVLENFGAAFNHWGIHWSPEGKYISYFKDKHWWVYNIDKRSHTNVTIGLEFPVHNLDYDYSGLVPGYGNPGWSTNDDEILLYDQYDIWAISPTGKSQRKLTNGRKQGITYRLYDKLFENYPPIGVKRSSYNLLKEIVLTANNLRTKTTGYGILKSESIRNIIYGNFYVDFLKKGEESNNYMYSKQRFDLSPQLVFFNEKDEVHDILIQSNPQQQSFYWGKSRLLHYTDKDGKELQAALFFPANYDSKKKYPMVVHVYEKKSWELHRYRNPSKIEGYNPTNFVNEGYFVLYPDIKYEINNPGLSAVDCVTKAVKVALNHESSIDKDRLGIIGHSFGGYETTYIISQTGMFGAAIAGAPITDLISSSLSIDSSGRPNLWRYEAQQHRFSGPIYQLQDAYIQNSPIHQISSLNTPLLVSFGNRDLQVNWHQGIELYNAIRRMGKEHVLLIYPEEGHVLHKRNNKLDYSKRILEWLDYHLNNNKSIKWIDHYKS